MQNSLIEGLVLKKGFLNPEKESQLLRAVDGGEWSSDLNRRTQHFGFRYDYRARRIDASMACESIPPWGRDVMGEIRRSRITTETFDQLLVNEYLPGQGISPHVDCVPCFVGDIVSVSLGGACVMTFTQKGEPGIDLLLESGDLLLLRDEARYKWRHQIKARKTDRWGPFTVRRERRVSLTFRKVLLGP